MCRASVEPSPSMISMPVSAFQPLKTSADNTSAADSAIRSDEVALLAESLNEPAYAGNPATPAVDAIFSANDNAERLKTETRNGGTRNSTVFGVTSGGWVLPDGPLDLCLVAAALSLTGVLFPNTPPTAAARNLHQITLAKLRSDGQD